MATQKERPGSWKARGLEKRDFQHDHSGPEVPRHQKKGKGKKFCIKNKGPHVYDSYDEWRTYGRYRYRYRVCKCGKQSWQDSQRQYLTTVTYIINGEKVERSHWGY